MSQPATPVATVLVAPAPPHPKHIPAREVTPESGYTRLLVSDGQSLDIPHANVVKAIAYARANGLDAKIDLSVPGFQTLGRIVPAAAEPVPEIGSAA